MLCIFTYNHLNCLNHSRVRLPTSLNCSQKPLICLTFPSLDFALTLMKVIRKIKRSTHQISKISTFLFNIFSTISRTGQ